MKEIFKLKSDYKPSGDQDSAIEKLVDGINKNKKHQVLLGATGTGKTFTIANVIEKVQKPTLVLAHNKTLAGQLYAEFKELFPENKVEYFVSYYDYYQPEAYVPSKDLYIEKDSSINDEIDELRHSATSALINRKDVIVVSSVSCIYNIGERSEYEKMILNISLKDKIKRDDILEKLVSMQFTRNNYELKRGTFRVRGDIIELMPASSKKSGIRIELFDDEVEKISNFDPITGRITNHLRTVNITPATLFVTSEEKINKSISRIEEELEERLKELHSEGKLLEEQRLKERTMYDIEMLRETHFCHGIENYSRHLSLQEEGRTPNTLIDFFPEDFLLVVDESHVTIPQVKAMYNGDRMRKQTLVDYGFRLPSALDNRPLKFEEFNNKLNQVIYVSATPAEYELSLSDGLVEQIIRPTFLLDPSIEVKPTKNQIDDIITQINNRISNNERVLITTLTIKMSEELTNYLKEAGYKVMYLHNEIKTLERLEIIRNLRLGKVDVVVGINLLREGLDIPEVSLICILDADKQGFLRSEKSLIQTIGRAARNVNGHVIMYADMISDSMQKAIDETNRRRTIQEKYNKDNNITPKTIIKDIKEVVSVNINASSLKEKRSNKEIEALILELEKEMKESAALLDFEKAVELRDAIFELKDEIFDKKK